MPKVKKITANLFVQDVAACARFWVERMGFTSAVEVPGDDGLLFSMLVGEGVELMYNSFAAAAAQPEIAAAARLGPSFVYVEVDDIQSTLAAMHGVPVVLPMHDTFYGAREFTVRDPGGHFIIFAQQGAAAN